MPVQIVTANPGTINSVGNNAFKGTAQPITVAKPGVATVVNGAGLQGYNPAPNPYGSYTIGNGAATPTASTSAATGATSGSYNNAAASNAAAFYLDQGNQLQNQINQLDGQQNIGLDNIANSYNTAANRLDQQNAVAKRNYDNASQQNVQSYSNSRNGIITNTRASANALQRLLGINGSGNSSAAYEQAPYAAGLQGSQNLNQAQQTYNTNGLSLENNWQDTQRNYSNGLADLGTQKYQQENALRSSIAQSRAGLLNQIGSAQSNAALSRGGSYEQAIAAQQPYQQQVNSLLNSITQLGQQYASPVMRTSDVSFANPAMSGYSLGNQAAVTNKAGATNDVNSTFLSLLAGNRDQYGNLIN